LKEVDLPDGVILGAIVRDGEVIIPRGTTVIEGQDRVILLATAEAVKQVEKMFSVRLEFF
ncbi:MAG: Trk system potassium transport protein TrkA, partial [Alphaproteobacteria bacterium]|nr:Trk system potassium transport protein TrkA [Alphaproteobacteria bacterium]